MSKFIVCVFDDEKKAYAGAQAIEELDNEGSIAVYEGAIISKDEKGNVSIEDAEEEGPLNMASGMMVGSLIGILGGPVGMLVGSAVGTLAGAAVDIYSVGVGDEFLNDVSETLMPGKYAVVAEISESWTVPLDSRMEALGGSVSRTWRIDVEDAQIERDVDANKREMAALKEEWNQAVDTAKEKVTARINETRDKLKALNDRIEAKIDSLKNEISAKVRKLDEQIAKAGDDARQKYEKMKAEMKADYDKRIEKLKQAGQLAADAMS